jgi:hypothetical protein
MTEEEWRDDRVGVRLRKWQDDEQIVGYLWQADMSALTAVGRKRHVRDEKEPLALSR